MQQLHAIRPLINNSNQVLWKLPEGKPNGKEPLVDKVNDQRTRVLQAKQKGNNCWYYATKRVRTNYGENCGDFKAEREFEKKFSEYRKQLTFIDEVERKGLEFWIALLNKRDGNEVLNAAAPDVVIEIQQLLSKVTEWLSKSTDTHFDHFKFFSSCAEKMRYETSKKFAENDLKISMIDILKLMINSECSDLSEETAKELLADIEKQEGVNLSGLSVCLSHKIRQYYLNQLGFVKTSWNPEMPIDSLINDLKHGPLLDAAKLGKEYYTSEPKPQEPIEGNPIWAWPQYSYNEKIMERHSIVVVGAEKLLNKEFVYFIDPADASDPDNPATQKIYKVSYGRFVSAHSCPQSLVKVMEKDGYIHYNPNLPNFTLT